MGNCTVYRLVDIERRATVPEMQSVGDFRVAGGLDELRWESKELTE